MAKTKVAVLGFFCCLTVGCATLPTIMGPQIPQQGTFTHLVTSTLALGAPDTPAPGPAPAPAPVSTTHPRSECPTGGWITQGDGHRTRCLDCDPPWADEPPDEPEPEVDPAISRKDPAQPDDFRPETVPSIPTRRQIPSTVLAQTGDTSGTPTDDATGLPITGTVPVAGSSVQYVTMMDSGAGCSGSSAMMSQPQVMMMYAAPAASGSCSGSSAAAAAASGSCSGSSSAGASYSMYSESSFQRGGTISRTGPLRRLAARLRR